MEVEEEKTSTSNHLLESATTAVEHERLLENDSSNDTESGKEESESMTREEEQPSVNAPKLDDPKPSVAVTEAGVAEEKAVECGGGGDSAVVETTDVLENEKDGDGIPAGDAAAVECGGDLANSNEEAVIVRDDGESVVEENVKSREEADGYGGEGGMETVKVEEDGGVTEENINIVQVDETVTEGHDDVQVGVFAEVNDEAVGVAEDVEEEKLTDEEKVAGVAEIIEADEEKVVGLTENEEEELHMADGEKVGVAEIHEEEAVGVTNDVKEEEKMADEEKVVGVAENHEEEVSMADEDKAVGLTENEEEELHMADEEKVGVAEVHEEEAVGVTDDVKEDEKMADEEKVGVAEIHEEEAVGVTDDVKEDEEMADEVKVGIAEIHEEEASMEDEEKVAGSTEHVEEEAQMADEEEEADEERAVGASENDEEVPGADEERSLDTEMDTEEETTMADQEKGPKSRLRKRKRRAKNPKSTPKSTTRKSTTPKSSAASKKMTEEDVCFICFDGGDLVLCDFRNCPKAYHAACVNRDEAFFQTKGRWNCGWHLCSVCEKKAEYMCYSCTFSLCKTCIKTNDILFVNEKAKKGFCEACMKTLMLIEKDSEENQGTIDFNDKSSWEYLFKDYWTDLKATLNLSLDDLLEAKNIWKGSEPAGKHESPAVQSAVKDDGGSGSENPSENPEPKKGRKRKPMTRNSAKKEDFVSEEAKNTEWASKELLEFVSHMRKGDESIISQFDVQALLLEYIKTNKLRDSRRKSQIICDSRLERLFGKPRVGHFEMLKLLESHFIIKEDPQIDDNHGSVVDTEVSQVDDDEANETLTKGGKDRKRKMRKKGDRGLQCNYNREDYAAIDMHNVSLIYLRRKLAEDLLDDTEAFRSKVVGTFVRIKIVGANLKQDMYRLVKVTGTTKGAEYTLGKKKTDTVLEILNLNKTETTSIDAISNQEFTEDECKRLRQSIKCGFISRLTVGDILDKAMELQAARVNDWLETEVMRLSHLRDRASDLGRKKELRECVEKLQVLKTPEERARRLEEFPVIHDDPTMDPNYESEDDSDTNGKKQDVYSSSPGSRFSKRRDYPSKVSWTGTTSPRSSGKNHEFARSFSNRSFLNKPEDATFGRLELHSENSRDQRRDTSVQPPSILKKPSSSKDVDYSQKDDPEKGIKVIETEKMWHYKDPSGKIQGPFSMVQLRKWSNNKYFPVDLKVWGKNEKEDDGILLTDALEGRFTCVDRSPILQNSRANRAATSVEIPSLPSPTPARSITGLGQVGPPPMVQPIAGQSLPVGPHGWTGCPPQNPQPVPSGELLGYIQWSGAPNMFQTPINFLSQPATGPQQPPPPVEPPPLPPPPPPPQPNGTWATMPVSPNMGLAGPTFQGNVNPTWIPAPPAQGVAPNQGWVPTQGLIANENPNWVGPLGNPGSVAPPVNHGPANPSTPWVPGPATTNMTWAQTRNQTAPPVNPNPNWGSAACRNRTTWDESESQQHNRSGFSGQKRNRGSERWDSDSRGNRRHWDHSRSFNNKGSRDSPRS